MRETKIRSGRGFAASALALVTAFASLVFAAPGALADDRATLIEVRAERLANNGECAEAIQLIATAPAAARGNANLLRLRGKCEIEIGRYSAAVTSFDAARSADPSLANLDLMSGIARYHAEDFAGAATALEAARAGNTDRQAELELYSGLVLLRSGKSREAALALEKARRLDADAVEPVASYYAALAWDDERERDRAQAAVERLRQNPEAGTWASRAAAAVRTEGGSVPWWIELTAGIEYDDNVVLRATGDTQRDDDDFRGVWSVAGGWRLIETENWSGGVLGSYRGSAHFDQSDFDLHYPSAGAWLDRRLGENTLLRFRYDYAYAWIDYDPFLASHEERVSLLHDWGAPGTTELFVEGQHYDFQYDRRDWGDSPVCGGPTPCGLPGVNEAIYRDRDGDGVSAGLEQRVPIGDSATTVRAGYEFNRYWSQGDEWDFDAHRVHAGLSSILPLDVLLDLEGAYTYAPFRHPSSFPNVPAFSGVPGVFRTGDRKDHVWTAAASLEKAITDDVSVSTRYSYTHSNSNSEFFDYDRHIVGAYVTVRLP